MLVLLSALSSDTAFHGRGPVPEFTNWKSGRPGGVALVAPWDQGAMSNVLARTTADISTNRRNCLASFVGNRSQYVSASTLDKSTGASSTETVSYTHLTLPTNREV